MTAFEFNGVDLSEHISGVTLEHEPEPLEDTWAEQLGALPSGEITLTGYFVKPGNWRKAFGWKRSRRRNPRPKVQMYVNGEPAGRPFTARWMPLSASERVPPLAINGSEYRRRQQARRRRKRR